MAKEASDRSRARRLRAKEARGETLSRAEERWLDNYAGDTARWTPAPAAGELFRPTSSAPASDIPVHTTEVIRGVSPDQFMAAATLPPAPADAPPSSGAPAAAAADPAHAGAPGEAPAASSAPEPIVDPIAPAPAPINEEGAKRFAGLVVAFNAFGLKALTEMFPPGSIPLPPEHDALIRSEGAQGALLATIHASAVELAHKYPFLCNLAPSPAVVVLGASSVSSVALYFRHVKPLLGDGKKPNPVEVGPSASSARSAPASRKTPAPAAPRQPAASDLDAVELDDRAFDFSAFA